MIEFCALRAKAYALKLDDDNEVKKAKGTKKSIVKREITYKNYVDALFNDEVLIKSQQRFRSDHHKFCTEEVNKIALSSNNDKRIQTIDKITTYPYGTNTFMVCENEMLLKNKWIKHDKDIVKTEDTVIDKNIDKDIVKTEDTVSDKNIDKDIVKTEDTVIDEEISDNDEEIAYIEMLNKMIDRVNEFKLTELSYTSYMNKVNEILIVLSDDDEIYEDPWLKLNELYNINALIDEFLDKIWKLATVRNRKADKKINIDKYLEIDKYVDEYTDITDGKIDLFNNLGSILTKATVEIQNEAYIINDLKQKENLDIKTLKTMHETLEKVLIK